MSSIEESLNSLSESFKKCPEYLEYMRLKDLYESDSDLKELRINIAMLSSQNKVEEKENLLNIYNNHPLVVNFKNAENDLKEIVLQMKEILSD